MDYNRIKNQAGNLNPLKFLTRHKYKAILLAATVLTLPYLSLATQLSYCEGSIRWISDKRLGQLSNIFKQQIIKSHRHVDEPGLLVLKGPGSTLFSLPTGTLVISECMKKQLGPGLTQLKEGEQKRIKEGVLHKDLGVRMAARVNSIGDKLKSSDFILLRDLFNFPIESDLQLMAEAYQKCRVDGEPFPLRDRLAD